MICNGKKANKMIIYFSKETTGGTRCSPMLYSPPGDTALLSVTQVILSSLDLVVKMMKRMTLYRRQG